MDAEPVNEQDDVVMPPDVWRLPLRARQPSDHRHREHEERAVRGCSTATSPRVAAA
jgi:hypothetical protein